MPCFVAIALLPAVSKMYWIVIGCIASFWRVEQWRSTLMRVREEGDAVTASWSWGLRPWTIVFLYLALNIFILGFALLDVIGFKCKRQNCITPPFGISLGWTSIILGCIPKHRKKFGMDPKLRPSQTPTIHPSQFFWHVPHSEPNWKTCVIYQSIRLRWKWKFISLYIVKLIDHDCLHNMFFWFDKCLYFTK